MPRQARGLRLDNGLPIRRVCVSRAIQANGRGMCVPPDERKSAKPSVFQ